MCAVSTRSMRDRRDYGQMVGQCELRKVRIKERAKNGSIRVAGSGDDLTGVMRAGKNENECGRANAGS